MAARIEGAPLMSSAAVATAYKVHRQSVMRWTRAGKLHPIRLPSGQYRFFRAEVEALMNGKPLTPEQLDQLRDQLISEATS